jgi:hypothetical protein
LAQEEKTHLQEDKAKPFLLHNTGTEDLFSALDRGFLEERRSVPSES